MNARTMLPGLAFLAFALGIARAQEPPGGDDAGDLAAVADEPNRHPHTVAAIEARVSERGRRPDPAREFFPKFQNRIPSGVQTTPDPEADRIHRRSPGAQDEPFACSAGRFRKGLWNIDGIFLAENVPGKVYRGNAGRILFGQKPEEPKAAAAKELRVRPTADFELTGDGSADPWRRAEWEPLSRRGADGLAYETRVKVLYSQQGLYVLMDATDRKLSSALRDDFANLWTEDVFEVFLWPDERDPIYFEYEISPLGRELPILVPNLDGKFLGWRPWNYEGARRTRKATSAVGGALKSGGEVTGWKAEVFIPHELLNPLRNVPPRPGTRWRANFYRMDYDDGRATSWDWARVGPSFHDFQGFGTLVFEGDR